VLSGEPGVQFYSANALDGSIVGKLETHYEKHSAFCLEPQHFPDSPNQPKFPSTVLRPGTVYTNVITYRLTAIKESKRVSRAPAQRAVAATL
jgi:aldose 1-epimerase